MPNFQTNARPHPAHILLCDIDSCLCNVEKSLSCSRQGTAISLAFCSSASLNDPSMFMTQPSENRSALLVPINQGSHPTFTRLYQLLLSFHPGLSSDYSAIGTEYTYFTYIVCWSEYTLGKYNLKVLTLPWSMVVQGNPEIPDSLIFWNSASSTPDSLETRTIWIFLDSM